MAERKNKTFESASGSGVTIWFTDPDTQAGREIRIPADGTYETNDKNEIDALQGAPDVNEKKGGSNG